MASEQVDQLFGDLRSAVASHRVLDAHEIAKNIYNVDRAFHAEAVIPYLQSHPVGDGSMTRDTMARLEKFKQWVRRQVDAQDEHYKGYVLAWFLRVVHGDLFEGSLIENGQFFVRLGRGFGWCEVTMPSSVGLDAIGSKHVLRPEWRDALWSVLDERGLI